MKEAYLKAIEQIKARCKEHLAKFGEYLSVLEVDDTTFETLRAGTHASKEATQLVIPYLEEAPASVTVAALSSFSNLLFVVVVKEEKS